MKKGCLLLIGLAVIATLAGCATPSRVETDYGTSFNLAKFNQTLNPEAEKNFEPVTGFDGIASQATLERYRKGFREKSEAPVYSINIGGLGVGAGAQ